MKDYIDASDLRSMIVCADAELKNNVQLINDLNVFPVPDGDTGTNMSLTFSNAVTELNKQDCRTISDVASCAANALLRSARGNSGVILSLLFRGIAKRLKGMETAGAKDFAHALREGVDAAYKAVMKPAEGTILTVSRKAAERGSRAADLGSDVEGMFMVAIKAGSEALANTQNINPVLKKAGVVDAGGKGFMVILETMLASLRGEYVMPESTAAVKAVDAADFELFDTGEITFAFDTVYIIHKDDPYVNIDPLREYLGSIGDCLVIGESDAEFKVHVHTNIPGSALTESQKYGTLELAKIENMRTQHDNLVAGRKPGSTDDLDAPEAATKSAEPEIAPPEKDFGFVTVCAGEGMAELFRELGADRIVTGGQTMNPSTEDILREVNRTPAETVFILPNNKNIIMAAEQCAPLTEKKVIVLPSKTVPQGITALLNYESGDDVPAMTEAMNASMESVHTAMVTYAARDSDFDGHSIHAGEYLALMDGALVGSYSGLHTLFKELCWTIDELSPEFITVYYGEDVTPEMAQEAGEAFSGVFTDAEVNVVSGGQPVYYFMISIE